MSTATLTEPRARRTTGGSRRISTLERVAWGDPLAINDCIDRFGALIHGMARRFLGNLQDAEEAVQDVFADLWRRADRFDPSIASEKTFIMTVARRRLIDRHRRSQRGPEILALSSEEEVTDDGRTDTLEISEELSQVQEVIASLKPDQQQALNLSVFHGLSHSGIAREMGVPLGTIKTHIRRALAKVRAMLPALQGL